MAWVWTMKVMIAKKKQLCHLDRKFFMAQSLSSNCKSQQNIWKHHLLISNHFILLYETFLMFFPHCVPNHRSLSYWLYANVIFSKKIKNWLPAWAAQCVADLLADDVLVFIGTASHQHYNETFTISWLHKCVYPFIIRNVTVLRINQSHSIKW